MKSCPCSGDKKRSGHIFASCTNHVGKNGSYLNFSAIGRTGEKSDHLNRNGKFGPERYSAIVPDRPRAPQSVYFGTKIV